MKTKPKTKAKPIRKPVKPVKPVSPDSFTDIDRAMHQQARARGFKSFDDMLTNATEPIFVLGRTPKPAPEPLSPYDTPVRILRPDEPLQPGDLTHTLRTGTVPVEPACTGMRALMYPGLCMRPVKTPRWVPFTERRPSETDLVEFGKSSPRELVVCHASSGLTIRPYYSRGLHAAGSLSYWLEGLQPPTPPEPEAPEAPKAPSATDTVDAIIAALDARGDELLANPFGPNDPPRLREQAPLVGAAFKKAAELARKVAAGK